MSANIHTRLPPVTRTWAPRTEDLDNLSTSDIREDHTSDLQAIDTQDVHVPEDRSPTVKAPRFTPLVQSVGALTSDLEPSPAASVQKRSTSEANVDVPSQTTPARATSTRTEAEVRQAGVAPGCVLKDRYLIERVLGSGGTALVFRARDLSVNKNAVGAHIAIKTPRPEIKDRERAVRRLQHEFKHAQNLAHPNIARVLELNSDGDTWFMTMELIEGRSLAALLREPATLPEPMKRAVLSACAQALAYAHSRDVVHGDFKPANVLVSSSGHVKVFDFGAATSQEGEDHTRIPAGTPAYASPQVLSGVRPDPRDDVFSFACVAYELLTGHHPFDRKSALEAREQGKTPARAWNLSTSQWLALLSALAWERDERPGNISAFVDKLLAAPAEASAPAAAVTPDDAAAATKDVTSDLPDELVPSQRSWGFFVFLAVAAAVLFIATQRDGPDVPSVVESAETADAAKQPLTAEASAADPLSMLASSTESVLESTSSTPESSAAPGEAPVIMRPESPSAETRPVSNAAPPPASTISFRSSSIDTSESAIAAVFVLTRSGSLSGRTRVEWRIRSGTAKVGEDFISPETGTVVFADGQSQRAIYVPLRNDTLVEGDETFTMELTSIQRGRLGEIRKVEATIRDDD